MTYTNTEEFGGKFLDTVDRQFKGAENVSIASGYTSLDILLRYKPEFLRIAKNGGVAKLLVGMAFYEGLSQKKLDLLTDLSSELQETMPGNGVYVCYTRKFHGKVYNFSSDSRKDLYLGSSNFSRSGLSENIEATIRVSDAQSDDLSSFLEFLFGESNSTLISNADIVVPGSRKFKERLSISTLDDLRRYDPYAINTEGLPHFDYSLSRVANNEKSSLNVYFGKGRWTRSTGKVTPRPWYEVELITPSSITSSDIYPKGHFDAYTDDGYIIPMTTNGDYHKNIRSRGGLQILGMWIKKKLQDSGALIPLTPVTQDTLDLYGRENIRFYKIEEGKYYVTF